MISSPSEHRSDLEVRCWCAGKPLLAVCGRDKATGVAFVHVKAFRSNGAGKPPRLHAEVVVTAGVARIRCRQCLRWHRIAIVRETVEQRQEPLPDTIGL